MRVLCRRRSRRLGAGPARLSDRTAAMDLLRAGVQAPGRNGRCREPSTWLEPDVCWQWVLTALRRGQAGLGSYLAGAGGAMLLGAAHCRSRSWREEVAEADVRCRLSRRNAAGRSRPAAGQV
jgi:hypothetical protein